MISNFTNSVRHRNVSICHAVIHTKTNCDGFKDLGITFPSFELQRDLIEDTYKELKLDPLEIEYCEAHCTGTQAGDPSEMRAIQESMCKGMNWVCYLSVVIK